MTADEKLAAVLGDLHVTKVALQRVQMAELLDRVPHHGPGGSYSKAEGQCWPDCVACAWEKLKPQTP
jgi:hypothetical protein